MNLPSTNPPQPLANTDAEWLSALTDGESSGQVQGLQQACEQWAQSPALRQRWHTYHLIGDVMRSDELASSPASDASFMTALRVRLATEPVVLAPMVVAAAANTRRRPGWWTPAAVAAGFVAVAGVLVVARLGQPGAEPAASGPLLAAQPAPNLTLAGLPTRPTGASSASQTVIRDTRLDSYLRAHQGARGGGGAAAVPGGGLRNVDVVVPGGVER